MKRFTGNYSNTEHNFVIQNLPEKRQVAECDLQLISVLKNIILRGSPTLLSKYLQSELGLTNYFKDDYFKSKVPLIAQEKQNWFSKLVEIFRISISLQKNFIIQFPRFYQSLVSSKI